MCKAICEDDPHDNARALGRLPFQEHGWVPVNGGDLTPRGAQQARFAEGLGEPSSQGGPGVSCCTHVAVTLASVAALIVAAAVFARAYAPHVTPGLILGYVSTMVLRHTRIGGVDPDDGVPITRELVGSSFYKNRSADLCSFQRDSDSGFFTGDPLWIEYIAMHRRVRERIEAGDPDYGQILVFTCNDVQACNGLGSELKGISTALYVAMVTKRALFLEWHRHGADMPELFGHPTIDWRLPAAFAGQLRAEGALQQGPPGVQSGLCTFGGLDQGNIDEVLSGSDSCFSVYSSLYPSFAFDQIRDGKHIDKQVKESLRQLLARVDEVYAVGCAAHFLFSYVNAYDALQQSTRLVLSRGQQELPGKYVAVHLRFGDQMFNGSNFQPDSQIVLRALRCAAELGRELLGTGPDWGIFFASDSAEARRLALEHGLAQADVPLVFESHWSPVHMDQRTNWYGMEEDAASRLWGSLADFLLLMRARGLVQCFSTDPLCGVVNGFLHSGFSLVAAQEGMLPAENFRLVTSVDACSREDLPMV